MKKLLLSLSLILSAGFLQGLSALEIFEKDGLYYRLDNPDDDRVSLVAPPDGSQYSGDITLVPSVEYNGRSYNIFYLSWQNVFINSSIEHFTIGEGFCNPPESVPDYSVNLNNDNDLKKITIKSFQEGLNSVRSSISVGNTPHVAHLLLRQKDDKSYIIMENFNVFGPDGERLKPFLHVEGKQLSDSVSNIYPDENGIFTLDANWRHNGEFCGMFYRPQQCLVNLYVEYGGRYAYISCSPNQYQTGIYTEVDGLRYMVLGDELALCGPDRDELYAGDIIVPEAVTYESESLPVTTLLSSAFKLSDVTSVTLPSSMTQFETYPFDNCHKLEWVDLSALKVKELNSMFFSDTALTEVILPDSLESLVYTINSCPALSDIRIPRGCLLASAFNNCPGLIDVQLVLNTNDQAVLRVNHFTIQDMDGNVLPYCAVAYTDTTVYPERDGDVFTFNKKEFYYHPYEDAPEYTIYQGNVAIEYDNAVGDYLPEGSRFIGIQVPERATITGVGIVEADTDQDAPVEYFNLQGLKVNASALSPGIYIRRQGASASKVLVK